jgi:hypothetical protein
MAEAVGIIAGIFQITHSAIAISARIVDYCDEFRSFNITIGERIASVELAFRSLKSTLMLLSSYASGIPYKEIQTEVFRTLEGLMKVLEPCQTQVELFKKEAKAVSKKTGITKLVRHQFASPRLERLWAEILAYLPLLQESQSSLHTYV